VRERIAAAGGDPAAVEICAAVKYVAAGELPALAEVARRKLAAAGVGEIESAGLCTSCEAQLFFSHRRDGECSGRQAGLAWLREEG